MKFKGIKRIKIKRILPENTIRPRGKGWHGDSEAHSRIGKLGGRPRL